MCQMNADGVRERFYADIIEESEGGGGEASVVELILQIYVSWRAEVAP